MLMGKGDCISICNEKLETMWQQEWDQEQKGRHYYSVQPSVKHKAWGGKMMLS